jgi:3-hydroxybutyryl-CoA dehydrogenase
MKVAVVGAGIMGSGVAQLAAMAGFEAVAVDPSSEQRAKALTAIRASLDRFVRKGTLSAADGRVAFDRVEVTGELTDGVMNASVVIEAVPEVLELKETVLRQIIASAPAEALLGTNTSQLSVTRLAAALDEDAFRLVGIHFFNPPVMMRLVELIAGLQTSPAEIRRAREFAEMLGREVVVCRKDSPGFITSRAYAILRLECIRMLEEGIATAEDIDKAMRLGFNFPMGPLELGDMNGLDTYLHAIEGLERAHGSRFSPTVGLRNMVAANRLGRKTGAGFYQYENGERRFADAQEVRQTIDD